MQKGNFKHALRGRTHGKADGNSQALRSLAVARFAREATRLQGGSKSASKPKVIDQGVDRVD